MAFEDFKSFTEPLRLPYDNERIYEIPPVSAVVGTKLMVISQQAAELVRITQENEEAAAEAKRKKKAAPKPKPLPEVEFQDEVGPTPEVMLGDIYQQMLDDGCPLDFVNMATMTAYQDFLFGRETAEAYWNSGGDPKAVAKTMTALTGSTTFTAAGNMTRRQASTSGTKPRKKS